MEHLPPNFSFLIHYDFRSSCLQIFFKIDVRKFFQYSHESTCVEPLFNKAGILKACNFIKNTCFHVNIANISEELQSSGVQKLSKYVYINVNQLISLKNVMSMWCLREMCVPMRWFPWNNNWVVCFPNARLLICCLKATINHFQK